MRLGNYEFRPGLGPSLAMLAVLSGLLWLGNWQFERAVWKQGLVDSHAARAREPAVPLADLAADWEAAQYRHATVNGHYDTVHQLLLDNQLHERQPGYAVLTPLRLDDGALVLVNRGWVPAVPDRSVLPEVPAPDGPVSLLVMVTLPPEKTFRLADVEEADSGWPRVVQQIEPAQFERLLGHELLPVLLALDPADPHGFVREWRAVYGVTPDKHRAYAMQWYTLAVVLVLIYLSVNTRRIDADRTDQ